MARKSRKKQNKKRTRGGWIALKILGVLVILIGLIIEYAALNANTVHIRYAEVEIEDLSDVFDGTKLLFVSDIDICGINTPEKAAKLFERVQAAAPDILLLGGDYASTSIIDMLNQVDDSEKRVEQRDRFFRLISDFYAPLGKYAVAGENDISAESLKSVMRETGIEPLFNDHAAIRKGDEVLHIVGFNANTSGVNFNAVANAFDSSDCVIAIAHSPAAFPHMLTAEAGNSGNWADLMLAGHTHGGQIRLMDKNIIRLSQQEQSFLSGWKKEASSRILTTSGVGCETANLRIGSESEMWVITLKSRD